MHKVKIFRKKSFFGCFATYLIIVGYDIDRFKQLIKEINSYYKDNVKDLNKEKYYHNEIDNLKYYELKSGQTIEFDVDDGSTVFVCNSAMFNNEFTPTLYSVYDLFCSEQIKIKKDSIFQLQNKWNSTTFNLIETKDDICE